MPIHQPIKNANDAIALAKPILLDKNKEHFIGIYLNARNIATKVELVSMGTLTENLVHPREVFRPALVSRSAYLICLHNHPSGGIEPSEADVMVTSRLNDVGKLLGIKLRDHIIFTNGKDYYSFCEEGAL